MLGGLSTVTAVLSATCHMTLARSLFVFGRGATASERVTQGRLPAPLTADTDVNGARHLIDAMLNDKG